MQTTGRYFMATLVVASMSSASFAQGKEPTAKDMYEAYAAYWSLVNDRNKRSWEQCQAGQGDIFTCNGLKGSGGPMWIRIISLDKYNCTPTPDRTGHNCMFSAKVRVAGGNEFMQQMVANSVGSQRTQLFRREGGNWIVLPPTEN